MKTWKTGLFFAKGRFFDVWTGAGAGDKSLQFSRAPAFSAFPREWRQVRVVSTEFADGGLLGASGGHSGRRSGFASAEHDFGGWCAQLGAQTMAR